MKNNNQIINISQNIRNSKMYKFTDRSESEYKFTDRSESEYKFTDRSESEYKKKVLKAESDEESFDSEPNSEQEIEESGSFEDSSEKSEESEEELDPDDPYDARNIVIKKINDGNFGLGTYGDFQVYFMLKNNKEKGYIMGYMNATKLCTLAGKKIKHWLENKDSKDMISTFSMHAGKAAGKNQSLIVKVNGGRNLNEVNGTYVHRLLIPFIAAWASHDFALRVTFIVNKVMFEEAIEKRDRALHKKQCKIDRMSAK